MERKDVPTIDSNYSDRLVFGNESFDILDSGMAPAMVKEEPIDASSSIGRYEEITTAWSRPLLPPRIRKAKIFRTPSFHTESPHPDQDFIDETSRAVSSVDQSTNDEDEDEEDQEEQKAFPHFHQPPAIMGPDDSEPSTSAHQEPIRASGHGPLRRLSLQIGKKVVRLKVVDNSRNSAYVHNEGTGKVRCPTCRMVLHSQEEWLKHNRVFHNAQKAFVCVVCGIGFSHKMSLSNHYRQHSGLKSHVCHMCHKSFSRATNLVQHIKMHNSGRHYFCGCCGRCFKNLEHMEQHQATCIALMNGEYVPTDKPLRYNCSFCDKMFHHKRDKFIHERVHTGERPYQCGYCGRGFTQSQGLTIHIRIHTGERPYSCSYCGKQFRDSSSLRKHEFRQHMGLNDFESNELETALLEEEEDYNNEMWNERSQD